MPKYMSYLSCALNNNNDFRSNSGIYTRIDSMDDQQKNNGSISVCVMVQTQLIPLYYHMISIQFIIQNNNKQKWR